MIESRVETAVESYRSGSSCSQAVLSTYAEYAEIDEQTAHKLGAGFGGGMGRKQYTCGAVTGGVAVISLKYGNAEKADAEAKARTYAIVHDYIDAVEARLGSSSCLELLGVRTYTGEEHARAKELGIFEKVCPGCIRTASEELERILGSERD